MAYEIGGSPNAYLPRRRGTGIDPVDRHVGTRLRHRRVALGLSQEKLAAAVRVTYQQMQKYERGANRISASRLYALARFLDVPVGYFFEGLDQPEATEGGIERPRLALALARDCARLPEEVVGRIKGLVEALAESRE